MKKYIYILLVAVWAFACDEEPIGQQPTDAIAPGPVSNITVENIPGGAILTYDLPDDEDLLYVKAVYTLSDGLESEVRASLYSDTLKIEGFGDTLTHEVSVVAVDRSRNESEKVYTTVEPLTPPVHIVGETLNMVTDFGGVSAFWQNTLRAEVSVVMLMEDNNGEYVPVNTVYSTMEDGVGSYRGLDTIPGNFAIYVQDRWANQSEIKYYSLTPLYETQLDRLKFSEVILPGDEPAAYGWILPNLWDGTVSKNSGFHTGSTGNWPQYVTFDLGVNAQLSRMKVFQRTGYEYRHGNPRSYEVWGCTELTSDILTGSWDGWTKLLDCESIKPSGLPLGSTSAEDIAWVAAGEEFIFSPTLPRTRYIRFKVTRNWSDGSFFHLTELEFYGDNR
ncbi:DUF5000 domain-containing lipoprotein [Mangrovibacterium sp.]|uniref:DUF5000 domain-containing lipoprotein n=1 Tax=Mangrovibacterium sp. TaxID=1961364 RepID=UPI003563880A